LCRENGITVMVDLLLGGPGETAETARQTIDFLKKTNPDCVGAPLGVRVYPGTEMARIVEAAHHSEKDSGICRKYTGDIDLLKPTFYISPALGEKPAELIRDLIGADERFFAPQPDIAAQDSSIRGTDHNYNDNLRLTEAIAAGARGAYWDILRKLRGV
jgi:radical SAM superfamily enzyme YgiQ (UPF0313 family)